MLIVCVKCGQTGPAASVDIVDGAVRLRCGHCGHLNAVDAPSAAVMAPQGDPAVTAPEAPPVEVPDAGAAPPPAVEPEPPGLSSGEPALPPVKCPKCGHRQHETESCARCGLTFALVAGGRRPWEEFPPEQARHLPEARRLWSVAEAAPDDVAAHAAFVGFCRDTGLIAFAATCYRHRLADHPRDAVSQSWLDRVVRDATALAQTLHPQRDEFADQMARFKQILLVVVGVLCVIAVVLMFRMMTIRTSIFD